MINLSFTGRSEEINTLDWAWRDTSTNGPRFIAVIGDSGYGKTRLIQEFYNHISQKNQDLGYWPKHIGRHGDNLQYQPDIDECNVDKEMHFLWWGLRLSPNIKRNQVFTSAVTSAAPNLANHLARHHQAQSLQNLSIQRAEIIRAGGKDLAIDAGLQALERLLDIASLGAIGLTRAALKLRADLDDLAKQRHTILHGQQSEKSEHLVETIIESIRGFCFSPPPGMQTKPVIIFIDDVHFVEKDPTTQDLVEKLARLSREERWPLLLIVTAWEREWLEACDRKIFPANIWASSKTDASVINLDKLDGMDGLATTALPGLAPEQISQLVQKADGSPGLLSDMIASLNSEPRYFIGRDINAQLSDEGFLAFNALGGDAGAVSRMRALPQNVRQTLAIASLQGNEFSKRVAETAAERLNVICPREAIAAGENPHSIVSSVTLSTAAFRRYPYFDEANIQLRNLFDPKQARTILNDVICEIASELETLDDTELSAIGTAVDNSGEHLGLALTAPMGEAIRRARRYRDPLTAAALADEWLRGWESRRYTAWPTFDPVDVIAAWSEVHGFERVYDLMDYVDMLVSPLPEELGKAPLHERYIELLSLFVKAGRPSALVQIAET